MENVCWQVTHSCAITEIHQLISSFCLFFSEMFILKTKTIEYSHCILIIVLMLFFAHHRQQHNITKTFSIQNVKLHHRTFTLCCFPVYQSLSRWRPGSPERVSSAPRGRGVGGGSMTLGLLEANTRPNNADELKATIKATWASITPAQCHRLKASMPCRIDAVIQAKVVQTLYCTWT